MACRTPRLSGADSFYLHEYDRRRALITSLSVLRSELHCQQLCQQIAFWDRHCPVLSKLFFFHLQHERKTHPMHAPPIPPSPCTLSNQLQSKVVLHHVPYQPYFKTVTCLFALFTTSVSVEPVSIYSHTYFSLYCTFMSLLQTLSLTVRVKYPVSIT